MKTGSLIHKTPTQNRTGERTLDIRQLRYFVEIARCNNIQDAADTLYVSRQAASKAIMQLEEELGYPLFYRVHGGVTLTEQGRRYYDRVLALVQDFDTLAAQMKHINIQEPLRIAVPFTILQHFHERLTGFAQAHSDELNLILLDRTAAECHILFESGAVDMAISTMPFASGLDEGKIIAVSPIHYVMRKDHPLAGKAYVTLEDTAGENLIYYMNGYQKCFWLGEDAPTPSYTISDILLIYELIYQGKGIFPSPLIAIPRFAENLACVPYKGPHEKDYIYCAIAAHTTSSPRLQKICLELRRTLTETTET